MHLLTAQGAAGNGVRANGSLRVQGTQLVNQAGEPLQLRGLSSHGVHYYPNFTNIRALLEIKERGANLFRVAMYADSTEGGYNDGGTNRSLNKRLLRLAVENSLAADLYTIIDWHLLRDRNPLIKVKRAMEFFDEMSRIYAHEPGIIYEICNEPSGDTTWQDIKDYAERVIPVIRKNAPEAVVIVGTPHYSSKVLDTLADPLDFDNILYAYHMYTGNCNYEYIALLDAAREEGIPVFVSEWGISAPKNGSTTIDTGEGLAFLRYMHQHGISWAYWTLSNTDRGYAVIRSDVDKLSGWDDDDLTIPGRIIFSALKNGFLEEH